MDDHLYKRQWTTENVEKFISLYREHECLWNSEIESYKNAQMKNSALQKLMADMQMPGLTASVVKDRIKSIRTMYRRELNKVVKSMTTATNEKNIYKPKLFWFDKIDAFLRPLAMSRMDAANLGCPTLLLNSHTIEPNEDSDDNFSFQAQGVDDDLAEDTSMAEVEDNKLPSKSFSSVEPPRKKRKRSLNDLYTLSELQPLDNHSPGENEFDIFGKFISAQLKKMPLITALQCQQKIQDLLTSRRIEILEYQNERRAARIETFRGVSPFSGSIDVDCEEKPIVNKDILYLEKDLN